MSGILHLAWRYITYHRAISTILLISLTATLYLPLTANILLDRLEDQLFDRANATPLIAGARGSRFDLTLNALYFESHAPRMISMADYHQALDNGSVRAIPMHVRFKARGYPIVGTTVDYLSFRNLELAEGRGLQMLGDCLVGAKVASDLNLKPGDRLLSDPENVFDIAGDYPINMKVVGILQPARSADDRAVLVDIKTAWIIEGIGHGHQDLARGADSAVVLRQSDSQVVASAALPQHTEVTPENVSSFHFHSGFDELPLTTVIVVPESDKARVLFEGRYDNDSTSVQVLRPPRVVRDMMAMILRVKQLFDLGTLVVAAAAALFLALVILLSSRLRLREMETMFKLGCSRRIIFWVQFAEVGLILVTSAGLAAVLALVSLPVATEVIRKLIT